MAPDVAVCTVLFEYPSSYNASAVVGKTIISKKVEKFVNADVLVLEEERVLQITDGRTKSASPRKFTLKQFMLFNGHVSRGKLGLKIFESRYNEKEVMILINSDDFQLIMDINSGILASHGRKARERGTPIASPTKWSPELKKVRPRQSPSPVGEGNVPVRRFGFGQTTSPPRPMRQAFNKVTSPQVKFDADTPKSSARSDFGSDVSCEQRAVIEAVTKAESIFFTGGGGTGKSFLLKKIISILPASSVAVTASTGIAACHISGTTLHQFLGIGRVDASAPGLAQQLAARVRKNPDKLQSLKTTKILIIDEISLIDSKFFDLASELLSLVRANSAPFGGLQLVVCGDFLQLPPVPAGSDQAVKFCFESKLWKRAIMKTIVLTQIFRQADSSFASLLNELRIGKCSIETARILLGRVKSSSASNVLKLLPLNKEVAALNEVEMSKIPREVDRQNFSAIDTLFDPGFSIDAVCPARGSLSLAIGARVILVTTLSVSEKLVNGATGTLVRFSKSPTVPYVKFDSLPDPIGVPPHEWVFKQAGKEMARRRQIPLALAWGVSIHKSQGMTLDACEVSLDRIFEAGQAYVALSRCRSMEGLSIISDRPGSLTVEKIQKAVRANQTCVDFYSKINSSSYKSACDVYSTVDMLM